MTITDLLILLIPLAGTSLGAFTVFFMKDRVDSKVERILLGFAAGVMTAAAVWSLLIPSIEMSGGMFSWVPALVGFLLGIAFLIGIDFIVPRLFDGTSRGATEHKVLSADEPSARAEKNLSKTPAKAPPQAPTAPQKRGSDGGETAGTLHKTNTSEPIDTLHETTVSENSDTLHETTTSENVNAPRESPDAFNETAASHGAAAARKTSTRKTRAADAGTLDAEKSAQKSRRRSGEAPSRSRTESRSGSGFSKTFMLLLAVTIHNIPEGMAVGVALAGALSGSVGITVAGALALSLGIAIQNFPEGAIISLPLKGGGMSKGKSFLCGVLSGVVEPIGGVVTLLLASQIKAALPYLLSFAAGAMFYVVFEELIPEYREDDQPYLGTIGAAAGFALMMALDVALG